MQWSKLRSAFLERLAPELKSRVDIHAAKYPRGGRCWVTYDGNEMACVQAPGFTQQILGHSTCVDFIDGQTVELGSALFAQLHMPIEEALVSANPFIRGLAFLDGRCGKRRILAADADGRTSFETAMLAARLHAMGKKPCKVVCECCGEELPAAKLLTGPAIGSPLPPAGHRR